MKFKIGDKVCPKVARDAYYSNYGGNPRCVFTPDMIGVIGAVNVPNVRSPGVFNCVDFVMPGLFMGEPCHNHTTWRGAFTDKELTKVG